MDISEQTRLLKASKEVHRNWYVNAYPDVAALGLDPARHYLLYGAAMGRNPGKGFDTRFYLERYPEVLESGMNPLLHYILLGRDRNYMPRPEREADPLAQVGQLRTKLLSLGFTERPLEELGHLSEHGQHPRTRASASRELALWYMREKTAEGYEKALGLIARARADAESLDMRSKLATVEILCHHLLARRDNGLMAYQRAAVAGEVTPDVMLAAVNLFDEEYARVAWINQVLKRFGISALKLLPDGGEAPYDRLAGAEDLPVVTDGPLVTVLLAAYEAADTLPTALRSLQEQTWRNLEILVLDDCSPTPGTAEVAERFAAADPRIRLIHMEQNGGAYVARNRGLDEAVGEFVTIHDADDWSHPQKIETQVRLLLDNPQIMGCTTQQARAGSDLSFTRWTGEGSFLIPNTSSFMFRKDQIRESIGYWDTVRFAADNEMIKRIEKVFGEMSVSNLSNGPFSFQRDSDSSIVADEVMGINGFVFGVRKQYREAQNHHRANATSLKYNGSVIDRPYPAPMLMRPDRKLFIEKHGHFSVALAADFRVPGSDFDSCLNEVRSQMSGGGRTALIELWDYNYVPLNRRNFMIPEMRDLVDGEIVSQLAFGDSVTCDTLLLYDPAILQHLQRYVPRIDAKDIRVIVNQTPMSDYGPEGVMRFDIATCAANIRTYFGKDATWHPIGPLVRDALTTHHAADLGKVKLSDVDWSNIIDIGEWSRGLRRRGPGDKLRIGRHSRDSYAKWPNTKDDILSAYPAGDDIEVHVMGGVSSPAAVIGEIPANWTVHPFGSMHPKDFLSEIDIFVYFAHPDWVESFGRTIIEAMAVGVPVILPEIYRPLFKDAAIYATPETAVRIARKLHADPHAYEEQAQRATRYAKQNFSYEAHVRRIEAVRTGLL